MIEKGYQSRMFSQNVSPTKLSLFLLSCIIALTIAYSILDLMPPQRTSRSGGQAEIPTPQPDDVPPQASVEPPYDCTFRGIVCVPYATVGSDLKLSVAIRLFR